MSDRSDTQVVFLVDMQITETSYNIHTLLNCVWHLTDKDSSTIQLNMGSL